MLGTLNKLSVHYFCLFNLKTFLIAILPLCSATLFCVCVRVSPSAASPFHFGSSVNPPSENTTSLSDCDNQTSSKQLHSCLSLHSSLTLSLLLSLIRSVLYMYELLILGFHPDGCINTVYLICLRLVDWIWFTLLTITTTTLS